MRKPGGLGLEELADPKDLADLLVGQAPELLWVDTYFHARVLTPATRTHVRPRRDASLPHAPCTQPIDLDSCDLWLGRWVQQERSLAPSSRTSRATIRKAQTDTNTDTNTSANPNSDTNNNNNHNKRMGHILETRAPGSSSGGIVGVGPGSGSLGAGRLPGAPAARASGRCAACVRLT